MRFRRYALSAFVDSFDIIWEYNSICVINDNIEHYYIVFPIIDNIIAIYEWQEFISISSDDKRKEIAYEKYEEVKEIYKDTIQAIFDKFPKTIRYEVFMLLKEYGEHSIPNEQHLLENFNNRIVEMCTNSQGNKWVIYLLGEYFCCVNNFNAAQRIYMCLYNDCVNLINGRWR